MSFPRSTSRRMLAGSGLAIGAALVLVACSGSPADDEPTDTDRKEATTQPGLVAETLDDYYEQEIQWAECGDGGLECSQLEVPLDYADPAGDSITIAMTRSGGSDNPAMLINPGGPGVSGVDLVRGQLEQVTTPELRENFSIVGFDPRGVNNSSAVECLSDAEIDEMRESQTDPSTDEGYEEAVQEATDYAQKCIDNTGDLVGHVDTVSAAKDMDVIRGVLGEETMNYLGMSYGTKLGHTYAGLFPDRVGKIVLDAALSPVEEQSEVIKRQAAGFEEAFVSWAQWCATEDSCEFGTDADQILADARALFDQAEEEPFEVEGRLLPAGDMFYGVIAPMYSEDSWPYLDKALTAARDGDGSVLLELADGYTGRGPDGEYTSNITAAGMAINCLDYPDELTREQLDAHARELAEISPTFGPYLAYQGLRCNEWPFEPADTSEVDYSAAGAEPIIVIGTSGDPATPVLWSEQMAEALESGVLVRNEAEGHGAYGPNNECVAEIVDDFFINDVVPEDGVQCG